MALATTPLSTPMSERIEYSRIGALVDSPQSAERRQSRFMTDVAAGLSATSRFLITMVGTIIGLLVLTFVIGRTLPVDPVLAVVGEHATAEVYAKAREDMGLDKPIPVQFFRYVDDVIHGDFGTSVASGKPVLSDIVQFFPATLELATVAMALGILLGIPAGVFSAVYQGRGPDILIRFIGLACYSVPIFWIGLVSLGIFYAGLGWVGGPGRLDTVFQYSIDSYTGLALVDSLLSGSSAGFGNAVSHLVLPAGILGLHTAAYLCRMTRTFMIEALSSEYVITARTKGLSEFSVIFRHAFGNILVPLLTTAALSYAYMLEGAVLTETVFAWPGIGLYITQSLFSADMPAVMGATTVIGLCFIVLNSVVDFLYARLDPRIRRK